ncbi:SDR family oxidoreductase [Kribbella sp. NPDC051770]|uniref:SDR family NAD(P)-dependent oxidoreductase n=1 Tax=Kribbella sp. NPDC051770 TaxID=3155413 RepID=UPI00342DA4ED
MPEPDPQPLTAQPGVAGPLAAQPGVAGPLAARPGVADQQSGLDSPVGEHPAHQTRQPLPASDPSALPAGRRTGTGRLAGKVALLAGATSGIGRATAELFAREGAHVAIGGRREQEGKQLATTIASTGGQAIYVHLDVTDEASVEQAVRITVDTFGRLDTVVNLAGGFSTGDGPVTEASVDLFWDQLKTDLFGTFLCNRFAIPEIIKSGGGSVVNIGSMLGFGSVPNRDAYSSAKGAVHTLTRSTARRFAEDKVRVNAVAPAGVRTERMANILAMSPAARAMADAHILGLIEPEEVAQTILFLASDESRKLTGQVIALNGGMFDWE